MGVKAVLIRISTQEVIKKADYPKSEVTPLIGLDADLKWLIVNELPKESYNSPIEKLVMVEEITTEPHPIHTDFHQYKISWNKVPLSQEEQDYYAKSIEDSDNSAIKHEKYKFDGQKGFDRAYALIQRKLDQQFITPTQAKNIATDLYPVIEPLYKGLWQLAKININAETPPGDVELLDIFNKVKNSIINYVNNNY